jgi:hypothetical protein
VKLLDYEDGDLTFSCGSHAWTTLRLLRALRPPKISIIEAIVSGLDATAGESHTRVQLPMDEHLSNAQDPRHRYRKRRIILAGLSASYAGVTPHVYDANHSHANSSCMIPKTGTIELLWPTSHTQKEICCSCPSAGGREKSPRRLCLARSPPGHPCQGKLSITP